MEAAGFGDAWRTRQVPDKWRAVVKKHCEAQLEEQTRSEVAAHSSLQLFGRVSQLAGVEHWLDMEIQHPGKRLKVLLRAGALPLMVRVGPANLLKDRGMRICVMCDSGAVESEEHFAADCPYYADLRAGCLHRLHGLLDGGGQERLRSLSFLELVVGSGTRYLPAEVQLRAEKCVWDFLRLAWRRRSVIWDAVCVPGNPWRLPAPR